MPSRRISSNSALAPAQEISVSPFSSYNSDNVNSLTRAMTGFKDKDMVISGLDVTGTPHSEADLSQQDYIEKYDYETRDMIQYRQRNWNYYSISQDLTNATVTVPPRLDEQFPNPTDLVDHWYAENFVQDTNTALTEYPSGATYVRCRIKAKDSFGGITPSDLNHWFKISFNLIGIPGQLSTPKRLTILFGGQSKTFVYPEQKTNPVDPYVFYLQLTDYLDIYGNINQLTFIVDLDQNDPYSAHDIRIDNIKLEFIEKMGSRILPILDKTLEPNIPLWMIHPHQTLEVTPGIAVKDEAVLSLLGPSPSTSPVSTLTYSDPNAWIFGVPFNGSDFSGTSYFSDGSTSTPVTFDGNGKLVTSELDDGETSGPRKIDGDSRDSNPNKPIIKWAYLCVYYSFYKNPSPNKAYIGLVKEEELNDTRYGEDFMILAKLRFTDAETVDAIFYDGRVDLGFIDATRVTYNYLNELLHWDYRPQSVSIALDLLAKTLFNKKGILYFPTHENFINWRNRTFPPAPDKIGTGHGPTDYLQYTQGMLWQNAFDQCAYVIETSTFWRSKIRTKVVGPDIVPDLNAQGELQIDWEEIRNKRFEINWYDYSGWKYDPAYATAAGWLWYSGVGSIAAGIDEFTQANIATVIANSAVATPPKSWDDAKAAWPNQYYLVKSSPTDVAPFIGFTVVNPFNEYGSGSVPGAYTADIPVNAMLRADNNWAPIQTGPGGDIDLRGGYDNTEGSPVNGVIISGIPSSTLYAKSHQRNRDSQLVDPGTGDLTGSVAIVKVDNIAGIVKVNNYSLQVIHSFITANTYIQAGSYVVAGSYIQAGTNVTAVAGYVSAGTDVIAARDIYSTNGTNGNIYTTNGHILAQGANGHINADQYIQAGTYIIANGPDGLNGRIQSINSYIQSGTYLRAGSYLTVGKWPSDISTTSGDINGIRLNIGTGHHLVAATSALVGGTNNWAQGLSSVVCGGDQNEANAPGSAVLGGGIHRVFSQGGASVICGGTTNKIGSPTSCICAGTNNNIDDTTPYSPSSFIGGGSSNRIYHSAGSFNSSVLGGNLNQIYGQGDNNTIIGSGESIINGPDTNSDDNFIIGGHQNWIGDPLIGTTLNRCAIISGHNCYIRHNECVMINCYGSVGSEQTTTGVRQTWIGDEFGTVILQGTVYIGGADKTGCFKINHPISSLSTSKVLIHSCIEGPKVDLIYRGKIQLKNGKAEVNIDKESKMSEGTFEALTHYKDTDIFVQNNTGWDCVKGKLDGNILIITCKNQNSIDIISWMVISERNDPTIKTSPRIDKNGHLITEFDIVSNEELNNVDYNKFILDSTQDKSTMFKIPIK